MGERPIKTSDIITFIMLILIGPGAFIYGLVNLFIKIIILQEYDSQVLFFTFLFLISLLPIFLLVGTFFNHKKFKITEFKEQYYKAYHKH